MKIFFLHLKRISSYVYITVLSIIFLILSISFFSFDPYDSTLFYVTTDNFPIQNLLGAFGAHIAGVFFFLFGSSAFLVLIWILLCIYFLIQKSSFRSEWDRIAGFFVMLIASSVLSHYHQSEWLLLIYPGGLIGYTLYAFGVRFFNLYLFVLFFYVCIISSLLLILRCSPIEIIYSIRVFLEKIRFKKNFQVGVNWCVCRIRSIGNYIYQICIMYYHMFNGKEIEENNHSIVAFERDNTLRDILLDIQDEAFWVGNKTPTKNAHVPVMQDQCDVFQKDLVSIEKTDNDALFANESFDNEHVIELSRVRNLTYQLPSSTLFTKKNTIDISQQQEEYKKRSTLLEEKLKHFGIDGVVTAIKPGPVITLYEYQPSIDAKVSRIIALEDDLSLALEALSVRIIAPIPGRPVVGFEVSNQKRNAVYLSDILHGTEFFSFKGYLPLVLGTDIVGNAVIVDLVSMPHLLVAGSTGSGKSVALNSMLISLLCCKTPDQLKLILIDPKRLEFASYADIAHLLFPIVTQPKKVTAILRWVIHEMENRYEKMAQIGVRNIFDLYEKADKKIVNEVPLIVIVVDELSDLIMTAGKEAEKLIARIAQMARAAGIHMIVATQRPSVDVITGLIKVNFPSRISFRVTSKVDSRTILDANGAEKLLGKGDMLFLNVSSSISRIHGAYVSTEEIEHLVTFIRNQQIASYVDIQSFSSKKSQLPDEDMELYNLVINYIKTIDEISISLLQRQFHIGYNRSARIIEKLEVEGLVLPSHGGKTRKVIR